jgi:hypothetical protein
MDVMKHSDLNGIIWVTTQLDKERLKTLSIEIKDPQA